MLQIYKLRVILLTLAILTFCSAVLGGYFYHSTVKTAAMKEAARFCDTQATLIRNRVSNHLSENLKSVKVLSGLKEIRQAFSPDTSPSMDDAYRVLDHFQRTLEVSVCYLMDPGGTTIAATNRDAPDSFEGQNYAFRPYFTQSIQGTPTVYVALGVTSGKRGVYYSHPVYTASHPNPVGVAVIKAPFEALEAQISAGTPGIWLLSDTDGVIFGSNRKEWRLGLLHELPSQKIETIQISRQFGQGPWTPIDLTPTAGNLFRDKTGERYLSRQVSIASYPGWHLTYLIPLKTLSAILTPPLTPPIPYAVILLCALVGISVFFLYQQASSDIMRRKKAEDALRDGEKLLRTVINATSEAMIAFDRAGCITLFNPAAEAMFGLESATVNGKPVIDLFPQRFRESHQKTIQSCFEPATKPFFWGKPLETRALRGNRHEFPIEISLSAGEFGDKPFIIAVARDVTERKAVEQKLLKYQDQLRSLSSELLLIEERERRRIATDLHDSIGQTLALIKLKLGALPLAPMPASGRQGLGEITKLVEQVIQDCRSLTFDLSPPVLYELGLTAAIEWYGEQIQYEHGIQVSFTDDGVSKPIDDSARILLFRAARELLLNVVKHAKADKVDIRFQRRGEELMIAIRDNGVGFDPYDVDSTSQKTMGFGIFSIRERLGHLGGKLELTAGPGQGTLAVLMAPLKKDEIEKNEKLVGNVKRSGSMRPNPEV